MRRSQRGAENHETEQFCVCCKQPLAGGMTPVGAPFPQTPVMEGPGHPASPHPAQSILVTLFCCQPLGIIAIVFSAMAMGKNSAGDYVGAHADARKANLFGWLSFGLCLLLMLPFIVFLLIGLVSGM